MRQKSLLVSAAMLLGGSVAMAAIVDGVRQYPVWGDGQPTASDVVIYSVEEEPISYQYLYNIGCEGFFRGANNYMTRATLDDTLGYRVRFIQTDVATGTVALVDSVEKFSKYLRTFADGVTGIWVDNDGGANNATWRVTPGVDKTFTISNDAYADVVLGGIKGDIGSLDANCTSVGIYLNLMDPATDNFNSTWIAVSEDDYQSFVATRKANVAAYKTKVAQYNASIALLAAIKEAQEASVDVAVQVAVYLNEDASVEEIEAAVEGVKAAIKQAAEGSASAENPQNLSSLITNATFDNITYEGWSGSGFGSGGTTGPCAERYAMTFDTWQQIDNMPIGVYALTASAFYRAGTSDNSYSLFKANSEDIYACKLYAVNITTEGNDTLETSVMNNFKGIDPGVTGITSGSVATVTDGDDIYTVPNTMAAAVDYFNAGYYADNKVLFAVTEGSAKIGTYKKSTIGSDWSIFDNFALNYYGNGADAYQLWLNEFIGDLPSYDDVELVTASVVEDFKTAITGNSTASDYASVKACIDSISKAQADIAANVAAWQAFGAAVEAAEVTAGDQNVECEEKDELADFVDLEASDILNNKKLSTDSLINLTQWLNDLRAAVIQNGLTPGTDFTQYLTNPDFSNGSTGWSGSPTINESCGEKYGSGSFDVYQEVEGAPVGVYEISMQGFYRQYRDDDDAKTAWYNVFTDLDVYKDPRPDTLGYVYMNDNKTAMNCVYDYQQTEGFYTTSGYSIDPYKMYVYPNTMAQAAQAFAEGAYQVSAFGLVAKKGDVLRIGVKGQLGVKGNNNDWVIFDNFKLVYQGYKVEIIKPEFEKAVAALNAAGTMGSDVKAEVNELKAAADVVDQTDGKAMFEVLADIYAINNTIETSVALFAELSSAHESLAEAFLASEAVDATKTEAETLYKAITADMANYTDAQATEAIEAIEAMITKLAIPDVSKASDENGITMTAVIKTPSFTNESGDASSEGWTFADGVTGTLDKSGKDGKNNSIAAWGIEVGDILTIEGPKSIYNGTVELVNVTVVKIQKSLVKVEGYDPEDATIPVEGGNVSVNLTCKTNNGISVDIPDEAKDWLGIVSVTGGSEPVVTFHANANAGGDRSVTVVFKTQDDKGQEYTAEAVINQKGSIQEMSIADFLLEPTENNNSLYRITGVITSIANPTYGNVYIRDWSGEVYVYGIGEKGFFETSGLEVGDIVTLVGKRGVYRETDQLVSATLEDFIEVTRIDIDSFLDQPDDPNTYYMLTGTITEVANPTYGNLYLEDDTNVTYVYGCYPGWGATGDNRKNLLETLGLTVGDKLSVIGVKTTYNGTPQLSNGIYFSHEKAQ